MASKYIFREERLVFGETLKAWFEKNNWPQAITQVWANAYDSEHGPWASQISQCMPPQPKLEPKPLFFAALGQFNEDCCDETCNFSLVEDERYRELLVTGDGMRYDSGLPWLATDFFGLFIGEVEVPKAYK